MRCKTCHYSLAGLAGPPHRCPECGRAFDPNDARTYSCSRGFRPSKLLACVFLALTAITYLSSFMWFLPLAEAGEPNSELFMIAVMALIPTLFVFVFLVLVYLAVVVFRVYAGPE